MDVGHIGQRVKRRAGVAACRQSGREFVEGTVIRKEREGWWVRWDDGKEEKLSTRRVVTYSVEPEPERPNKKRTRREAEPPIPSKKVGRKRRCGPQDSSKPPPPPPPARAPPSKCEFGCWASLPPPPPPEPKRTGDAVSTALPDDTHFSEAGDETDGGPAEPAKRLSEGLEACAAAKAAATHSGGEETKRPLSWYRTRKAEPGMRVEWHGGGGFGAGGEEWLATGEGKWQALREINDSRLAR